MASAPSCAVIASAVAAGRSSAAVGSASLGWPDSGVVVAGAGAGTLWVVGDIGGTGPCRIEEGGEQGAAASQA